MNKVAFIFVGIISLLAYIIGSLFIPYVTSSIQMKIILWVLHTFLFSLVFMGPFSARIKFIKTKSLHRFIQFTSYTLLGMYLILLFILLVKDLILYFGHFSDYGWQLTVGALGLALLFTFIGFFTSQKKPCVKEVEIKIDRLPSKFKGLKIVQLSDVHVSGTIKKPFVEKIVKMTNDLNPDLIALTGDFVDGFPSDLKDEMTPFLELKSKHGVYFCPGNHDYYWGFEEWMNEYRKLNFQVLLNESREIKVEDQKILIGGVHDLASNRIDKNFVCDPDLAFKNADNDEFKILLAHQPKSVHLIKKSSIDLVLSGHTHAGQFFPGSLLIFLFQPYVKGLHKIKNLFLYINQGTGYWGPPNRFGTYSEITLITLK